LLRGVVEIWVFGDLRRWLSVCCENRCSNSSCWSLLTALIWWACAWCRKMHCPVTLTSEKDPVLRCIDSSLNHPPFSRAQWEGTCLGSMIFVSIYWVWHRGRGYDGWCFRFLGQTLWDSFAFSSYRL
jgi:hypothetical protein